VTFGQIIKKLRREADMTQEQLAETLSISGQAISRWENDIAMPDISLVPVLANLFNVTTDYLLGVDISRKQEKIQTILANAEKKGKIGYIKEASDIVRAGLNEYPGSYDLIYWLQHYLYNYARGLKVDERKEVIQEVIALAERILADSTNDRFRHDAIQTLCFCYSELGETEKAEKLAWTMPNIYVSCNSLLTRVYSGDKRYKAKRDEISLLISKAVYELKVLNTKMDDGKPALTVGEEIKANKKALTLINVLCEEGDYGEYVISMAEIYRNIFDLYYRNGDTENSIDYLAKAVAITTVFDSDYDKNAKHTSVLLRGDEYDDFYYSYTENQSLSLLNFLKSKPYYQDIQKDLRVADMCRELKKHAATR